MTIGFDFRMGGSINAGIGRYSFELLKHILLAQTEHSFVVFYHPHNVYAPDLAWLESQSSVTCVAAPFRHYSLAEQLWFPGLLNAYQLDVMHFPNFNVPIWYRKPYIVTIHDMVHHQLSGHKKSRYHKFLAYKYIIQHAADKAAHIITVSEASKQDIVDYLHIKPSKISVVYEAPSLESVSEAVVKRVQQNYGLTKPYFLFCGTLERKKNVPLLTQGFDQFLKDYHLDMDLVIAGKTDVHYPHIKAEALHIAHPEHVLFTEYVDNEVLAALYQGAYGFATASTHEGFGIPGLEAMHFGVPVVAANTKVFNEVYDDGAIYCDPYDANDMAKQLHLLAGDVAFHKLRQQKAQARAALFDWHNAATQTLALYNSIAHV